MSILSSYPGQAESPGDKPVSKKIGLKRVYTDMKFLLTRLPQGGVSLQLTSC